MIAAHRRRHRLTWIVLAALIPAMGALAWFAHRPAAVMDRLPPELLEGAKR
jgi:hypothetical protein